MPVSRITRPVARGALRQRAASAAPPEAPRYRLAGFRGRQFPRPRHGCECRPDDLRALTVAIRSRRPCPCWVDSRWSGFGAGRERTDVGLKASWVTGYMRRSANPDIATAMVVRQILTHCGKGEQIRSKCCRPLLRNYFRPKLKSLNMLNRVSVPSTRIKYPRIYKVSGQKLFKFGAPVILSISCFAIFIYSESLLTCLLGVLSIIAVGVVSFCYFSSTVILHPDRITIRNIFRERTMYRNEIIGIEVRTSSAADPPANFAHLISRKNFGEEIMLPTHAIQFDSILHEWVESIIGEDKNTLKKYREIYKQELFGFGVPD
jgi:hypothetical protein